jgi:CopG family nickel-responsive transcriptional regulator
VSEVARFSVSLEADLLQAFDAYVRDGGFATRSEAVRQLVRHGLAHEAFEAGAGTVMATLTIVYDHHRPQLVQKLLDLQHDHTDRVVASMHVHLDHDRCLEVLVLRGKGSELQALAEAIRGLKGVHSGTLALAGAADEPHTHSHKHGHKH